MDESLLRPSGIEPRLVIQFIHYTDRVIPALTLSLPEKVQQLLIQNQQNVNWYGINTCSHLHTTKSCVHVESDTHGERLLKR
jgi:hypothetical protein